VAVTVPPNGTRGSRFPKFPGFMARFFSRMQQRSFRRSGGGRTQGGVQALLLETIGARSGQPRSALLGFLEDGPSAWLVIASLAGSARNPAWLYNLARNPTATVELPGGRRVGVTANSLSGEELAAAWRRVEKDAPEYAKYLSVTDREMPIVRLVETGPAGPA
jgi:deazaflavin-dependent oxidoreductase (nitroreductase family)